MVIRTIILILSILMTTVLPGNWEGRTEIGGNESSLTELADGSLLINMRRVVKDNNGNDLPSEYRASAVSKDGGATWEKSVVNQI